MLAKYALECEAESQGRTARAVVPDIAPPLEPAFAKFLESMSRQEIDHLGR
jgi:hypothetical protein